MFRFAVAISWKGDQAFFVFRMQISYFFLKQTNPHILHFSCIIDVTYYLLALYIPFSISFYKKALANIQRIIIQCFTKIAHHLSSVFTTPCKES